MKKSIYILLTLTAAGMIVVFATAKMRSAKARTQTCYELNAPQDSLIRIGMIGDSWASFALQYQFDDYTDSLLYRCHIKSKTYIKGTPGAKSGEIYLNMFSDNPSHGTKFILQKRPHYCIVSSGINDLHGQYGEEYYKYHLLLIIKTLLHYNIKPVILEIPCFYQREQYKLYPFAKQTAYRVLSLINSCNIRTDNLPHYREAIVQALKKEQLFDKIIYLSTDAILKNQRDLYTDNMHISKEGYHLLGNKIVQEITRDMHKFLPQADITYK